VSGRKSGEVLAVIRQNSEIINREDSKASADFNKIIKRIDDAAKSMDSEVAEIAKINLQTNKNKEEFPDEVAELERRLQKLKAESAIPNSIQNEVKDLKSECKKITAEITSLLNQGEELRNHVTSHYQDDNYNKAVLIQSKIKSTLAKKFRLLEKTERQFNSVQDELSKIANKKLEAKRIVIAADDLEKKAILKLEKLAAEAYKQSAESSFYQINIQKAEKFLATEYSHLKAELNSYCGRSDKDVMAHFNEISNRISAVNENVEQKYTYWLSQKNKLEGYVDLIKNELQSLVVEDPTLGKEVSIFEFENKFLKKNSIESINSELSKTVYSISNDDFNQAQQIINSINITLVELKEHCSQQSIILKKNIALTKDVMSVLSKLNFSISTDTIDGNPMHGFKITCTTGNEIVELSPLFKDNGEVTYEINHIMKDGSEANHCSDTMKVIYKAHQSIGIPLTDIIKGKYSVIHSKGKISSIITDKKEQVRS